MLFRSKSTWIHKLLHFFRPTGNLDTQTISYSNLFQIVALKVDPSKLQEPSHYRAKVKVKSGVSRPPVVKRQAADSVCVTPAVVDGKYETLLLDLNLMRPINFRFGEDKQLQSPNNCEVQALGCLHPNLGKLQW